MNKAIRIGITWKILSAVFLAALVAVCGMLFLVQWSFDRGFLEYINRIEHETRQNFIAVLAEEYRTHGNWEFITDDRRTWRELYIRSFMQSETARERFDSAGAAPHRQTGRRGGPGVLLKSRVILTDTDRRVLAGGKRWQNRSAAKNLPNENTSYLPVEVDGDTIGYLAVTPRRALSDIHDLRFSGHIERTFVFIAALMLIVSMALALPLARRLINPVKALTLATRELAAGNYDARSDQVSNDELGELSNNFNTLADTLKRNETARQQWIADISHELRTPLTTLRGEIEALQDGVREYSRDSLETLSREVASLARLVDDLHELSMADIGALDYRKQDLSPGPVLEECLEKYSEQFAQKDIKVTYTSNLTGQDRVFADENRLQQLFNNLLNNSLHYTDVNGSLNAELFDEDKTVIITLEDSAPGVAAEELPRLFERLYRVDASRNRASGGSGLGLAICRSIVEAHNGSISAAPSDLGGLKIIIEIPGAVNHGKS